uniref:glutathione transferase n=1 Tax=Nelumbo nucifera TaxID=4432 RepID=A0A822ZQW1_NELNU|nr:TPA_asm: hypothetical protein HUJ06_017190 [Nelumbo nucifera]
MTILFVRGLIRLAQIGCTMVMLQLLTTRQLLQIVNQVHMMICMGSKISPSFVKFLKSKDPNDGSEQEVLDALHAFDDHLKAYVSWGNRGLLKHMYRVRWS